MQFQLLVHFWKSYRWGQELVLEWRLWHCKMLTSAFAKPDHSQQCLMHSKKGRRAAKAARY
jgi:hypothetical protein